MRGLALRRLAFVVAGAALAGLALGSAGLGASTTPTVIGGFRPESPDISSGRVVWADSIYGSYDIFVYEGATGLTTRLTSTSEDDIQPSISGDTIVFTRQTAGGADIYAYDLSTSSESVVVGTLGDQVNPTISGSYVAWEDRSSGFNPQIYAKTLPSGRPVRIASGYSASFQRPRAGGDWVVYEGRPSGGSDDSNVYAYNFRTAQKVTVASSSSHERVPSTDGEYVVFADESGGDSDITAYELATGSSFSVRMQPGEQTFPVVDDGLVYWLDNGGETRIHADTYEISSAEFAPLNSFGTAEMVGIAVDGGDLAWLEPSGDGKWQVRAALGSVGSASVAVSSDLIPDTPAWVPFRLAQIAAGGDIEAPRVVGASVATGDTGVQADALLAFYFSEPLDPSTIGDAVTLADCEGNQVEAEISYSALAEAVTVEPRSTLAESTYVLTIEGSVTDSSGNPLGEEHVAAFSTQETLADTQIPSKPGNVRARVSGLTDVELTWNASSDDSGIAAYHIYRYFEPIEPANLGSATLVDSSPGSVETYTVPAAIDEADKKYTYFYAMIAEDTVGKLSDLSASTAPDPHGMHVFGSSTNNCQLCHNTHGAAPVGWWALGAKSAEACYACHGATAHATVFGRGSTFNTQARFWDYTTDLLPAGGTRHRNAFMEAQNESCDACHTQHRRPYDQISGAYDPDLSYSKILKRPTDPADVGSALVYSSDTNPFDTLFCYSCHGAELVYMTAKGGASAYSVTAGDHNQAAYAGAAVAHGTSNVFATTRAGGDPGPLINCYACHNEHASPVGSLVDYRQSNTAASTHDQSGLCFECHKAASTESDSSGAAPFAWNGRDVNVEFQRASAHPVVAGAGGGGPEVGSWSQTTQADFAGDALTNVSALAGGSGTSGQVQLQSLGGGTYENDGNAVSTTIAQTGGTLNGWTDLTYTGDVPVGSTLTVDVLDGGDSSVLASGITPGQSPYSLAGINALAHPTLKLRANLSGNGVTGSSVSDDFNDASFDSTKWTDVHINATAPPAGGPWSDTESFPDLVNWTMTPGSTATWSINSGSGSPAAPCAEFVRTAGTGLVTSKITRAYDFSGISGLQLSFNWITNPAQIEPNTDYLRVGYDLGQDGTVDSWVWSSLTLQEEPGTWSAKGPLDFSACDGDAACDIVFEAGATQNLQEWYRVDEVVVSGAAAGGSYPLESGGELTLRAEGSDFWGTSDEGEFTYITPSQAPWIAGTDWDMTVEIPSIDNQAGNIWMKAGLMIRTGTSEANALVGGAKMAGLYQTGGSGVSFQYRTAVGVNAAGTGVGTGTAPEWLKLERRGDNISAYQSDDGSTWVQVGATQAVTMDSSVLVGICLTSHVDGSYSEANYEDFLVQQTSPPSTVTPSLYDWGVDYVWTPAATQASLTCYNCHNTHYVETGSGVWDMARASDPDNTKNTYLGTPTLFCLECHDGGLPVATVNANTLVPYSVGVSDMSAYDFFPGWNKSESGFEFLNSGHEGTPIGNMDVGCDNCHDPHGSDNDRLTAFTRDNIAQHPGIDRDNSATWAEEDLCYGCHTSDRTPNCSGGGCHTLLINGINVETAFSQTYTHPVSLSGRHSDIEDATDLDGTNRHAECVDCHDPHASRDGASGNNSSLAGEALRGVWAIQPTWGATNWTAATAYNAIRLDIGAGDWEAYLCFKCHSDHTPNRPAGSTDLALEFNPANHGGHNIMGGDTDWPKTTTTDGLESNVTWSQGGNQADFNATYVANMAIGYDLTCTECHQYQGTGSASGPHGSSFEYILRWGDDGADTVWGTGHWYDVPLADWSDPQNFCNRCHNKGSNSVHIEGDHQSASPGNEKFADCKACHAKIPHGWKRPRMFISTDYDSNSTYVDQANRNLAQIDPPPSGSNWNKNDCKAGCTGDHSSNVSDPYWNQ